MFREEAVMDIKYTPPTTTAERPKLGGDLVSKAVSARSPRPSTDTGAGPRVDTRATESLVQTGRAEGRGLHERVVTELRDQIAKGTYTADLDVVAERVADVLGIY